MYNQLWMEHINGLAEYLNVKQPNCPEKLTEALGEKMSFEQFKLCCKYLKYNHTFRSYPMLKDFIVAQQVTLIRQNKVPQYLIEASKKLRIAVSQLPEHANDLTDQQRDILDLVPRGFKIGFDVKTVVVRKHKAVVMSNRIEAKPEVLKTEEIPF